MQPNVNEVMSTEKPSLFGIITAPAAQFGRMQGKVKIALPMILLVIVQAVLAAVVGYFVAQNPEIMGEVPTDLPEEAAFFTSPAFVAIAGGVGALFGVTIAYFLKALFLKICMVFTGNDVTYGKMLAISVYASVIGTLGLLINLVLMAVLGGSEALYTSLAPLFERGSIMYNIGGALEVFSIWGLIVTAIGLQVAAGVRKGQAIGIAVALFIITLLFAVAGSLLPGVGV